MSDAWRTELRTRLAGLRLDPIREGEIVEELSQHLDARFEELRIAGAGEAEARAQAWQELAEPDALRQHLRSLSQAQAAAPPPPEPGRSHVWGGLGRDVRHAWRTLVRQPGITGVVVGTLALGIAVNTMVFTVVNGALIRPLPFADADRLVRLQARPGPETQNPSSFLSYLEFRDWQAATDTFEGIAAMDEAGLDVSDEESPAARVNGAYVSWNTFSLIGQRPALGRDFSAADDRAGALPVVLLGDRLWRVRYAGDPTIVGRTIRVSGVTSTVIGVMPPGFAFPYEQQVWLPLAAMSAEARESRSARRLDGIGRLRPGATLEQARAELSGIAASLGERYPGTNRGVEPLVDVMRPVGLQIVAIMGLLLGAVGSVLLIACANVANVQLARAADRTREATLRLALGASRWRIARQWLVESLMLAAVGAVGGLALSYAGLQSWSQNLPPEAAPPYWIRLTIDHRVLGYAVLLCVGSATLSGLVPAWHASRANPASTLNDSGRASTSGRSRRRWTGIFVVAQVALSVVLLTAASLMMQNFLRQLSIDVGLDTNDVMQLGLDLRRQDDTPESRRLFLGQLEARLARSSDVRSALASHAPGLGALRQRLVVEGRLEEAAALPEVSVVRIGAGYFGALDISLLAGRGLDREPQEGSDVVVVNERFQRLYFPDESALGRRIRVHPGTNGPAPPDGTEPQWLTIVGIAQNVRQAPGTSDAFDPVVYRAYTADPPWLDVMRVVTRSTSGPGAAAAFVIEQVRALDPDRPLFGASTVDRALAVPLWPQRTFGSLFAVFAAVAMLLATCGLYGVTAYAVSRRTREIGVRVALGADARRVWWAVAETTLRQLGVGLALGLVGAGAVATVLPAMLAGTGDANLWVLAGVALLLVMAGLLATAVPARRALRLDPSLALRDE